MIMRVGRWGNVSFALNWCQSVLIAILFLTLLLIVFEHLSSTKYTRWIQRVKVDPHLPSYIFRGSKSSGQCKIFYLQSKSNWSSAIKAHHYGCQRMLPLPGSCDMAEKIFFSKPPATCSHQKHYKFCWLEKNSRGVDMVTCDQKAFQVCKSPVSISVPDPKTGSLLWKEVQKPSLLAQRLTELLYGGLGEFLPSPRHYGFCFIRCRIETVKGDDHDIYRENLDEYDQYTSYGGDGDYGASGIMNEDYFAEQLLILPPSYRLLSKPKVKLKPASNINVNLILVDSVSRQHFFRSLKKSVTALEKLNSQIGSASTVLDFELVQTVKSRTFENIQIIFSGEVDTVGTPFGTQSIPPEPLKLSALLSKFRRKGYGTLWLEDLCYLWEWGISKDLHFLNKSSSQEETWSAMWEKLSESYVDSVEVTLAMCRVLEVNGVRDHFHGPDAVCYNGRHQHEYLFEYLSQYQKAFQSREKPFFSFTMTDVGHEDTGRRIQTLDDSLAEYLTNLDAVSTNTLTILFSDHGNSYGHFLQESPEEARVELFHPFMFLIIPHNVAKQLGPVAMRSLATNSQRLVSFLDLHYTLTHLVNPNGSILPHHEQFRVTHRGLFTPVNPSRTCNDMPRVMPNLCICQDFDTPLRNNSFQALLAYFAIGQLNDEIQRQFQRSVDKLGSHSKVSAFGRCDRLILEGVQNVRKSRNKDGGQMIKMDVIVQESHIFFVALSILPAGQSNGEHVTVLETYDRITPYSQFSDCADDIDLPLCICDPGESHPQYGIVRTQLNISWSGHYPSFKMLPDFKIFTQKLGNDCVLLVSIKHHDGVFVSAVNTCSHASYVLDTTVIAPSEIIYSEVIGHAILLPGGVTSVGLLYSQRGNGWTSSVNVHCSPI